ncbi:MAG TPA: hypothetical protein VNI61_05730 [Gemmatimonadales bacterium]|nr:hypothetical protein [Gemmatimonadales bacterium]
MQYQGKKDKTVQYAYAEVPDTFKTAKEVKDAIEKGLIPELYIEPGAIVSVQKKQGLGIA